MATGGHFGRPKIAFDHISHHFRSIRNFYFFSQNGCWRLFWMNENHFRLHFSPFQINTQLFFYVFFSKWPTAVILDDRKSPSIAFLAISDQYATFIFLIFFKMGAGGRRPFWITENHFRSHFSPFQINTHFLFFKMAAGGHFGSPILPQNNRVLPLCVINGYAKHEVDR